MSDWHNSNILVFRVMRFSHLLYMTSVTLARATRVVIHSIFVFGPSALGKSESYP